MNYFCCLSSTQFLSKSDNFKIQASFLIDILSDEERTHDTVSLDINPLVLCIETIEIIMIYYFSYLFIIDYIIIHLFGNSDLNVKKSSISMIFLYQHLPQ